MEEVGQPGHLECLWPLTQMGIKKKKNKNMMQLALRDPRQIAVARRLEGREQFGSPGLSFDSCQWMQGGLEIQNWFHSKTFL